MKKRWKHVKVAQEGDTLIITRDPLQLIKGTRLGTTFNTTTKMMKPKKGKGSYDRRANRRADWQDPSI